MVGAETRILDAASSADIDPADEKLVTEYGERYDALVEVEIARCMNEE